MLRDSFLTGFVPALALPFLGGYLFYLVFFGHMQFDYFLHHILATRKWVPVLSLGVILNLGLFMVFIRKDAERAARGVLGATFVFAFVVVIVTMF